MNTTIPGSHLEAAVSLLESTGEYRVLRRLKRRKMLNTPDGTPIPWQEEGFDGTKLKYLLMSTGTFFEGHRAIDDCYAALDILARRLPKSGTLALASLLEEARKPTVRVCAEGAPFEFKDTLKARGYRWNDGIDGAPRAWWKEVSDGEVSIEVEFLKSKIFRGDVNIPTKRITAYDRFSDRAGSL